MSTSLTRQVKGLLGIKLGMTFLDGTNIRAHQKAAGASRKGDLQKSEMIVKRLADLVEAMEPRPV